MLLHEVMLTGIIAQFALPTTVRREIDPKTQGERYAHLTLGSAFFRIGPLQMI